MGAPMWMSTFSDMVTLLLTFFVLLLSMASFEDPSKVQAVFESIRSALGAHAKSSPAADAAKKPSPDKASPELRVNGAASRSR